MRLQWSFDGASTELRKSLEIVSVVDLLARILFY